MKRKWMLLLILVSVMGFSRVTGATLTPIGTATYNGADYNLIYEDDNNLIWLDYSNPANDWYEQSTWVAGLNSDGVLTYNLNPGISVNWTQSWILPGGAGSSDFETNHDGMFGHLFYYELGGMEDYGLVNGTGVFNNLIGLTYWCNESWDVNPFFSWYFDFAYGSGFVSRYDVEYWGLAVRRGEVSVDAPAPVPEPATILLLGTGLVGLVGAGRKRLRKS